MVINNLIKTVMRQKHITQGELSDRLTLSSRALVSQYLGRELRFATAVKLLKGLNCTLQVVDNETGETYEVTAE